ncbi:MAG: EF-hand domain-containing protein [Planctomycetes bacterium]|nr:EF-hand domain-containing protein [Planctomycetota bacterium]
MRLAQLSLVTVLALVGSCTAVPQGRERKQESSTPGDFFERLDTNGDGKVTLGEAPEQGKMLVEFLLSQSGKKPSDPLTRQEFLRLNSSHAYDHAPADPYENAAAAALGAGEVQPAPANCPACAMGLTAEFVFKRLDVDEDRLVTVTEFMRSPGMQDETKAREAVGRLDKTGDGRLSFEELETAYKARHANCKKPPPATIAADAQPDGRGDANRFAQVFILRSDQDGDGRISKDEFRGSASGFDRLDKNKNGFIEADELDELHQRRLNDPMSMRERLESGDVPMPPQGKR